MGLAGPSKKRKISHDPNNTNWTRSTTGFGHRILSSQGWSPGTILGADPNSPLHTIASQTGIKVTLKDNNLGLGCKTSQEDTCTGLGDLQSLLGRLNGKSDGDVRKEEDIRRKLYVDGRFGMKFVKGEVLESTWVTSMIKKEDGEEDIVMVNEREETETDSNPKYKSKGSLRKKDNKKKQKSVDAEQMSESDEESVSSSSKDDKFEKQKRKEEKRLRRVEKRARKEEKRLRKEEKRSQKAQKKILTSLIASSPSSTASTPPILPESISLKSTSIKHTYSVSLPNSLPASGTSTPIIVTGRQALRSKWIAQKKMAVMDAKALNEILMIKA